MSAHPVSKIYAQALFDLASEAKKADAILAELIELRSYLSEQKQITEALESRAFSVSERARLATEFVSKLAIDPVVQRLFSLLVSKERLVLFGDFIDAFSSCVDESRGVVRGTVTTTNALSDSERDDLARAFSKKFGKQVILSQLQDKSILGGLVVNIMGRTFDGSLKTSLRKIRDQLLSNA